MNLIVVLLRDELTDLENLPPLLEDREQLLAPPIDPPSVILEYVGFLNIGEIVLRLEFIMVEYHLYLIEVV